MSHLFHIIMDSGMIDELLQLDLLQETGDFSCLIVKILQLWTCTQKKDVADTR